MPEPSVYNKRNGDAPTDAVYVGRPSPWGNPFSHKPGTLAKFRVQTREQAIQAFKVWLMLPEQDELRDRAYCELRGKSLVCWCYPQECHAQAWLELVNAPL